MGYDTTMVVECRSCPMSGIRCDDCVVTVLHGLPMPTARGSDWLPLDEAERGVVDRFVAAGMIRHEESLELTARREPWGGAAAAG